MDIAKREGSEICSIPTEDIAIALINDLIKQGIHVCIPGQEQDAIKRWKASKKHPTVIEYKINV